MSRGTYVGWDNREYEDPELAAMTERPVKEVPMITTANLRERALAALRKEEADQKAAEEVRRLTRRAQASSLLRQTVEEVFADTGLTTSGGTEDWTYREAYNAPTLVVEGVHFYLNASDGLPRMHDGDSALPWLWAIIRCSRCMSMAATTVFGLDAQHRDPMANLGELFELAGDPPLCGICRPTCQGCAFGDEDEHTCQVVEDGFFDHLERKASAQECPSSCQSCEP